MTDLQKNEITSLLIERKESQGLSLSDISKMSKAGSDATISDILSRKWQTKNHISDKIWNKLASWLRYNSWVVVPTTKNAKMVLSLCQMAKRSPQAFGIISEPGLGKSESLKLFASKHSNVVYLECAVHWTRKVFLSELLRGLGKSDEVGGIPDMFKSAIDTLKAKERPLIIIDEADKLKDGVIDLFNALYNATLYGSGWILSGAPYLEKRIEKGRAFNRQSFKEIYSRIGKEYHKLGKLEPKDISEICRANGVTDVEHIQEIINRCDNDLRRVKNLVDKFKLIAENEQDA